MIEARGLSRSFASGDGELRALDDVSLAVAAGELVAIVGASGSGKSTLMNLLGCLDRPTSGVYHLEGRDVAGLSRAEVARIRGRTIGFVFQGFHLLGRTSALENVELPLVYQRVPRRERRRLASEALARVGLADRAHHRPGELSGGQQQRVAIARALVTGPRLVLADEPTGNLDSRTSAGVMGLLAELTTGGITVVVVTHEPDVAAWAERVITLRDGRLVDDRRRARAA
jgi:putative ABC transport system ATP-binding protein